MKQIVILSGCHPSGGAGGRALVPLRHPVRPLFHAHLFAGQENSTRRERAKSLPSAEGGGRFRPTSPLCPRYRIYLPLVLKSAG
ncbi:MAG: hypothetical protein KAX26_08755 [Anaerolineae bacterium]|nr:hypothetical protein [Anaerolineae bacterium]